VKLGRGELKSNECNKEKVENRAMTLNVSDLSQQKKKKKKWNNNN